MVPLGSNGLRGSYENFGIIFIIGPILLKFSHQNVKLKKKHLIPVTFPLRH